MQNAPSEPNFFITRVRHDSPRRERIIQVEAFTVLPNLRFDPNAPLYPSKTDVIQNIKSGYKYMTLFQQNNTWTHGEYVIIENLRGVEWIKTIADGTTRDNLDMLPTF